MSEHPHLAAGDIEHYYASIPFARISQLVYGDGNGSVVSVVGKDKNITFIGDATHG
mgnify:CR=1 FL=1